MALSTIEEKRKRKEAAAKQLTPTTDPFLASIARGDYTPPKPVVKQAKPTPGNVMSESFYGGADYSPRTRPQIGQSQPDGSRLVIDQRASTQSNTINPPPLKEIPNAQRDAELGKMNVGIDGNIVTYDIGGNTLSYDASQTDPSKISLRNINRASGNAPTWDDYHAQQRARLNTTRGGYYGPTPLPTELSESSDKSLGGLFLQGLQARKDRTYSQIENDIAGQDINRAQAMTQANRNLLMADSNRISEMDVRGQNKLRDIQGQVAQQPVPKENSLKPIVVKQYDEIGNVIGEEIKMPNAEGTGYVGGNATQSNFTVPKPATTAKLIKMRESKDPNLAAAEAEYKMRFGNLPY